MHTVLREVGVVSEALLFQNCNRIDDGSLAKTTLREVVATLSTLRPSRSFSSPPSSPPPLSSTSSCPLLPSSVLSSVIGGTLSLPLAGSLALHLTIRLVGVRVYPRTWCGQRRRRYPTRSSIVCSVTTLLDQFCRQVDRDHRSKPF